MNLEAHPEFPDESRPVRDTTHKIKRLPCCLYLEDQDGKVIIKLNETSSMIWSLCNGEFTVGGMIELLEDSYPEAGDVIRKDVYRVLDEFQAENIITLE